MSRSSKTWVELPLDVPYFSPSICACCSVPSETSITAEGSDANHRVAIEIPVCFRCKNHAQGFLFLAIGLPLLAVLAGLVFITLLPVMYPFITWFGITLLGGLLYFILRDRWLKNHPDHARAGMPVVLGVGNAVRIWFWNREFAEQFAEANGVELEVEHT